MLSNLSDIAVHQISNNALKGAAMLAISEVMAQVDALNLQYHADPHIMYVRLRHAASAILDGIRQTLYLNGIDPSVPVTDKT